MLSTHNGHNIVLTIQAFKFIFFLQTILKLKQSEQETGK